MMRGLLIIVIALIVIILTPLITIWSLNTLFPVLAIPFTIETWIASFCLFSFIVYKGKN